MSPSSSQILYTRRDDQIISILDAIDGVESRDVVLVVPRGAAIFGDILNVKLLGRECEKLGKRIVISTQDPAGSALAKKAGIPVEVLSEGETFLADWQHALPHPQTPQKQQFQKSNPFSSMPHMPPASSPGSQKVFGNTTGGASRSRSAGSADRIRAGGHAMDIIVRPAAKPAKRDLKEEEPDSLETTLRGARKGGKKFALTVFAVALLAALGGAAARWIQPSATVRVYPRQESVEFEMDLSGRTDVSSVQVEGGVIPLERLRLSEKAEREFPSSGEREVATKARGRITVYNTFGSSPQLLVATTRFLSESGKLFRTPQAVTLPGATIEAGQVTPGSIEIEIVADQAGEEFNIPAGRFSIPGFVGTPREKAFYGLAQSPMTGGFRGTARVIEARDVEQARVVLLGPEKERVEQLLRQKFPPSLHFLEGALTVVTTRVDALPQEGEVGETFKLTAETTAEALLFREEDVLEVVKPSIASHLASEFIVVAGTEHLTYTLRQFDSSVGRLAFTALVSVRTQAIIDQESLVPKLAGLGVDETKAFFAEQQKIERADLSLWPFWSRRLPADAGRIRLLVVDKEE